MSLPRAHATPATHAAWPTATFPCPHPALELSAAGTGVDLRFPSPCGVRLTVSTAWPGGCTWRGHATQPMQRLRPAPAQSRALQGLPLVVLGCFPSLLPPAPCPLGGQALPFFLALQMGSGLPSTVRLIPQGGGLCWGLGLFLSPTCWAARWSGFSGQGPSYSQQLQLQGLPAPETSPPWRVRTHVPARPGREISCRFSSCGRNQPCSPGPRVSGFSQSWRPGPARLREATLGAAQATARTPESVQ